MKLAEFIQYKPDSSIVKQKRAVPLWPCPLKFRVNVLIIKVLGQLLRIPKTLTIFFNLA
jgi:hypothetical protein